jgi:hypothetical protein
MHKKGGKNVLHRTQTMVVIEGDQTILVIKVSGSATPNNQLRVVDLPFQSHGRFYHP